jgi:hypothetical protein
MYHPEYQIQLRVVLQAWAGDHYDDVSFNWVDITGLDELAGTECSVDQALVVASEHLKPVRHEFLARVAAQILAVTWRQGVLPFG